MIYWIAMGCILVILDGVGDRAYRVLGGKTPLQAARTPYLDRLASIGANGIMHAARPGQALSSENAHFSLFGYQPGDFPGRGYLEAVGEGIKLDPSDAAILARMVNVRRQGDELILENDSPPADQGETNQLAQEIASYRSEGVVVEYIQTRRAQGILTMKGDVSPFITDSSPILAGWPVLEPLPWAKESDNASASRSARVLTEYLLWCHAKLEGHPVNARRRKSGLLALNAMITNRAGRYKEVEPFGDKWGLSGLCIASGAVYHGLARFLGLDLCPVKDTENPGDDLAERLQIALSRVDEYDFIHVHTKAPDAAAHTKDVRNKEWAIEELDEGIGKVFDNLISDDRHLVIITADHSTPASEPLIHSGEPVPMMMIGRGARCDNVGCFNEIDCAGGALGFVRGEDLMYLVLNALDRAKLSGLMDTPENQAYWPGKTRSLRINH